MFSLIFLSTILLLNSNKIINAITALDFRPMAYKYFYTFFLCFPQFVPIASLPFPPVLEGPLAPNSLLANAQFLARGNLTGPESVLVEGNTIYTTTLDGKVVKLVDGQIVQTLRIKANGTQTCGTYDTEPVCGRPLGIRRLDGQHLVVADAYFGIFKVDFQNNSTIQLLSPNQALQGANCTFFNDLDVAMAINGTGTSIFFSCTSTRWDRRRFMHDFLEGQPTGSLLKLDLASGNVSVLVKKLNFANGVQVHPDQQSVLVNECSRARIIRYYFDGPKQGKQEIFASNLPGFPDNIRLSFNGSSFLVAMAVVRHSELVTFVDKLGPFPEMRFGAVQFFPENNLAPFFFANLLKLQGFVLELDLKGKAIRSYQDPTGSVIPNVSEASDDESHIYLGSIVTNFIAKVPKQ